MAQGYLIIYDYKGKKGNDISKVGLVDWILKYREKFPGIVVEKFQEVDIPLGNIEVVIDQISIDKDLEVEEEAAEIEEEMIEDKKPFDRAENLRKAREVKKNKAG